MTTIEYSPIPMLIGKKEYQIPVLVRSYNKNSGWLNLWVKIPADIISPIRRGLEAVGFRFHDRLRKNAEYEMYRVGVPESKLRDITDMQSVSVPDDHANTAYMNFLNTGELIVPKEEKAAVVAYPQNVEVARVNKKRK
jgi:hypothetical protein